MKRRGNKNHPGKSGKKGKKKKKYMEFEDLWKSYFSKGMYPSHTHPYYSKEELRSFADGIAKAARYIAEEKPDTIIVPLRGAYPLVKGVLLALKYLREENPELKDYWPYVMSIPNTGPALRKNIGKLIGKRYKTSNIIKQLDWFSSLNHLKSKLPSIKREYPRVGALIDSILKSENVKNIDALKERVHNILELSNPRFEKVFLIDEVMHGGAIEENYRVLSKVLKGKEIKGVGILHAPGGKTRLAHPNRAIWKKIKLIPVRKVITMDNPTLLGITYLSKNPKTGEPALYGIDREEGVKATRDVFPLTPARHGWHKKFLEELDKEIARAIKKSHKK